MIKKENINIKITISREQYKWLENEVKKTKTTKSKYIASLLSYLAAKELEHGN